MKKICIITTIEATVLSFFVKQCVYLSDNGFDVTVVCSTCGKIKRLFGEKVKCKELHIARGIDPFSMFKSIKALKSFFEEEKFDIVQYSTPNAAFVASLAAKLAGVKIRNYHLMGFRYIGVKGVLSYILKSLEKLTCKFSSHIECVSKSNLKFGVENKIFNAEKATVVWNGSTGGVDIERFAYENRKKWREEIRKKLGFSGDDFVFGFVGRITKDKGINEILKAFSEIKGAKLLLLGNKENVEELDQMLYGAAEKNENIVFCDAVSDVEKYFAAIDVLLLPSYREGFGNVVIEAAAVGTPAIISNIPGPIDAVIPNVTAKVFEVKNAEQLKCEMEFFMNDPQALKKMSEQAFCFAKENFDSNVLNEKILERKRLLLENGEIGKQ